MRILFLGPACAKIEERLLLDGHCALRTEEAVSVPFLEGEIFDFGISYRYKKIIAEPVISWFRGRLVNLHISLLPWNRGYDPNLWSYLENTLSGVTIHVIDAGIDTGPVLAQREVRIDRQRDTLRTSWNKLAANIEDLFNSRRHGILEGLLNPIPQGKGGSFHRSTDKNRFSSLLEEKGWDTPVKNLIGKAFEEI
jgi:methionyl-tRNA formyltransferase